MTFTDWIYKWFMRGHDSPPGTRRFTCPSSQLLLRSPDMLISEAPSSSARSSLPQNWVIDLPWLFIFRFEWHSWEFFQLSWSNLYFLHFPETWHRGEERFWRYRSIFKRGTHYTALLSERDGTAALLFFLLLFKPYSQSSCRRLLANLSSSPVSSTRLYDWNEKVEWKGNRISLFQTHCSLALFMIDHYPKRRKKTIWKRVCALEAREGKGLLKSYSKSSRKKRKLLSLHACTVMEMINLSLCAHENAFRWGWLFPLWSPHPRQCRCNGTVELMSYKSSSTDLIQCSRSSSLISCRAAVPQPGHLF